MVTELVTKLVTESRNGLQFWQRSWSAIGATICAMELVSNLGDEFVFVLEWVIVGQYSVTNAMCRFASGYEWRFGFRSNCKFD